MDPPISWCQRPHLARTLHIRRRFLEGDRTVRDAITDIPLDLRQVPRHLAEGAAAAIRTVVILVGWQRFEKLGRKLGFHVPDLAEAVQLVDGCHDVLRMRGLEDGDRRGLTSYQVAARQARGRRPGFLAARSRFLVGVPAWRSYQVEGMMMLSRR